ncbi:MAG: hypothetical protein QOH86_2107 [Sphingomonadales bacterium]|jgi:hypothetical protein|nr:hypothetical protein [Sphingomonadales bacterium]
MRLFLPALLSLAVPAAYAATPVPHRDLLGHRQCAPLGAMFAKGPASRAAPHRLDEEPPAQAYLAVLRTVQGCAIPATMREEPPKGR